MALGFGSSCLLGGVTIYSLVDRFGSERLNTDGPIYRTADVSDEVLLHLYRAL